MNILVLCDWVTAQKVGTPTFDVILSL